MMILCCQQYQYQNKQGHCQYGYQNGKGNQGANNNAAGIGVLLETARTIGNGLTDESELDALASEEGTVIHGEEAARSAGALGG